MPRSPMEIDWNDVFGRRNDSPPPELKVVPSTAGENEPEASQGEAFAMKDLSDHQLSEKIQRLKLMINRVASKLPDGGEKCRRSLRAAYDELNRRKDAEKNERSQRDTRANVTVSPGLCSRFNSNSLSLEARHQSSFASHFSQKLDKADNAFRGELKLMSEDKYKNSFENGRQMHKEKQPAQISSREFAFRSFVDKSKERSSHAGSSLLVSSGNASAHKEGYLSTQCRKRRSSETCKTNASKSKKVLDVVLLDEEGVQPIRLIDEENSAEWKEAKMYYPTRDDPESVELSYSDLKCLDPESYLSSPIMNFYIQYIQRSLSSAGGSRGNYYIFNTYFFNKLEEALSFKGDKSASFLKLRRWWKGVNLFQKAFIFLPIHGEMHWSLVIICFPGKEGESGPIILHLDSLGIHCSNIIFDVVDRFIKDEWNYLNDNTSLEDLPFSERIWRNFPRRIEKKKFTVPQQKNEYDCGLFVLYFIERFIRDAPERFTKSDFSMFGSKWFKPEDASGLRVRIRDLLKEEFVSASLENGGTKSPTSSGSTSGSGNEQDEILEV